MQIHKNYSLKNLTTFQVEAFADQYIRFDRMDEIFGYLSDRPLENHRHLILGGGSNLLFVENFEGIILHPLLKGIEVIKERADHALVKAMAGENWDDLVEFTVARGYGGIENLSLIPGSVGASAMQNIGAYGVEVKSAIDSIEAISSSEQKKVTFDPNNCGFDYRFSHFKGDWKGQFIITAVVFKLLRKPDYVTHYSGVQETVDKIGPLNLENLRKAIIKIRQSKLPDPAEIGNAGSFFKNPVVSDTVLNDLLKSHPDMPSYLQGDNQFKLAAGWMIEKCGWKGKTIGRAAVHDKQALVLVNPGSATGREIFELSEQIKNSVIETFGIELKREVLVVQ